MTHGHGYHSAAILLPDGSVIVGGDPNGASTPNERYLPSYFFKPRPAIPIATDAVPDIGRHAACRLPPPPGP